MQATPAWLAFPLHISVAHFHTASHQQMPFFARHPAATQTNPTPLHANLKFYDTSSIVPEWKLIEIHRVNFYAMINCRCSSVWSPFP
jgi:hypothetical protein